MTRVDVSTASSSETETSHGAPLVFAEVFRENVPFAWRCLRRLGVPEKDVEDVCQEVFLVVHKKLGEFDHRSSVRAWIYGICARKASDHRRLAYQRRERVEETLPDPGVLPTQGEAIDRKRALSFLDRTLTELDDDKRSVFVLYEIEGLSMNEIASAIGCPLQTAYSRLHAARKFVEAACQREQARRRV
jgi:RNA polymerase sigma-70 factor (ECF subfamily)